MEREGQIFSTRVIGVAEDGTGLIMSGPIWTEGTNAAVKEGDIWTLRAMYGGAAVRFDATVGQVSSAPFPHFYLSHISGIERRNVRQWPRAFTSLWAMRAGEAPRVITDLSVGGARIATKAQSPLQVGQTVVLSCVLKMIIGNREMGLDATVVNLYGRSDPKHSQVEFYGVKFDSLAERSILLIHAYVQEHLNAELDRIWHVLTGAFRS
jgi:hypothetical protein